MTIFHLKLTIRYNLPDNENERVGIDILLVMIVGRTLNLVEGFSVITVFEIFHYLKLIYSFEKCPTSTKF